MDRIIKKKKWTIKRILSITAISAFAIFILYLLFFRDKSSRLYVDRNQLTIASVQEEKFKEFIPVDGVVYPKTTVFIDAVQGGVVESVYVEDGDHLHKGDTILKLLNTAMELNYMEQETRMLAEVNNLQNTKLSLEQNKYLRQKEITQLNYEIDKVKQDFKRKKKLHKENVISDVEFEDAERDYKFTLKQLEISLKLQKIDSIATVEQQENINISLDRMRDNLKLLRKNMENAYVKAPASGVLSSFDVEIGETKSAGQHLGQIDKQDGFKLEANIDERYISRVYVGQPAEFDFAGKTYTLFINKIYTDVTNGSFQVDLLFENDAPEHIKRGQTLQLKLVFSSETDAIIVKRGGFFQETGGNWIYVVDQTGAFAYKRSIRINRQNTNFYEITEGLQPGEEVIISSYDSFGDKDKLIFK
ncbi:MAG: efflux RND transporter periplasmic adaptor subunit [Bacteroidales bacterium]|nr:efflux RND transporter periplasmic adaptor subunit [Bacteroidales bacterium]MCF8345363.1 efflux RND transporter periplasmic adaptor subunit [Bacteroidales bacterium]MCF8350891.1 efflux RND transporter periplasmic adaptor subunit [Bacteroidales bacterium]MCF8376913.1 efflux RND transporter periplasmic adaptor subunit [Bacteroidales bacterium]MCF8400818.1 efflux RND transporter periplasmic adaptor subunit [Bacteroidales bacterium]